MVHSVLLIILWEGNYSYASFLLPSSQFEFRL
jgi:hypothetical protein